MASLPIRSVTCAAALIGLSGILAPAGPADAQQSPPPAAQPAPPSAEPAPGNVSPGTPAVKPSEAPASGPEQDLIGLDVFSSDGTKVGEVRALSTGPGGDIVALHVRTGGFLGFGGRTVAVPQGRFNRIGQSVRLDLDADAVTGLPDVKE